MELRYKIDALPGDEVRQIMWGFADRYDLQMLVQTARAVARGPVARAVAMGARNTHEWTPIKAKLLEHFDEAGITASFMDPAEGGYIEGPKNLALALIAFELCWVDAGAATASLANNLGLAPIHEKGTPEQRHFYLSHAVPKPGQAPWRYAFALTEPIPFVGVDTGVVSGRVRVAEWVEGQEPILQVEKRGRFITNMDYANVVAVAVQSDDPRIKGSCMIIVHETDPGVFDRGSVTKKLVHQLSSTRDPIINVRVPASRIIGGYTVKDGVIVPNYSHSEVIEAVFKRTRVTVGVMTAAKLLSAIEPVLIYARRRFRGGDSTPGTPRYDLGLLQKEDVPSRLLDVWITGEAAASLGFAAARMFDQLDPLERQKDELLASRGLTGRAAFKELMKKQQEAIQICNSSPGADVLGLDDILLKYVILDALANVYCPACKLWNTGYGATMMREAVSLMGGYGITEDCPGFLPQKWMDAQLEATYEGPEAVQRLQLSVTMTNELFLTLLKARVQELRDLANKYPQLNAGLIASTIELWLWTLNWLQTHTDSLGNKLYHKNRQSVSFPMADALCWVLASYEFTKDVVRLAEHGAENPALEGQLPNYVAFYSDLCAIQAARAAGEVGRVCTELVCGWMKDAAAARESLREFFQLRAEMDCGMAGCRMARDRAIAAICNVTTREALDYPAQG